MDHGLIRRKVKLDIIHKPEHSGFELRMDIVRLFGDNPCPRLGCDDSGQLEVG